MELIRLQAFRHDHQHSTHLGRPFATRAEHALTLWQRLLLKNPFVPLAFRITVLAFAVASLGVAATLYRNIEHVNHDESASNQCAARASTYMAICVGSIAIPYVGYVTWDEYMSKPYVAA